NLLSPVTYVTVNHDKITRAWPRKRRRSHQQLPGEDLHRVAADDHPVAGERDPDRAAPGRALEPGNFGFLEFLPPVRPEAAVGRTGHRILRDHRRQGKEPGDKIDIREIGSSSHDDAPCGKSG